MAEYNFTPLPRRALSAELDYRDWMEVFRSPGDVPQPAGSDLWAISYIRLVAPAHGRLQLIVNGNVRVDFDAEALNDCNWLKLGNQIHLAPTDRVRLESDDLALRLAMHGPMRMAQTEETGGDL